MKFKKKIQNEIHHMGIIMVIINLFSKISKGFNIFFIIWNTRSKMRNTTLY